MNTTVFCCWYFQFGTMLKILSKWLIFNEKIFSIVSQSWHLIDFLVSKTLHITIFSSCWFFCCKLSAYKLWVSCAHFTWLYWFYYTFIFYNIYSWRIDCVLSNIVIVLRQMAFVIGLSPNLGILHVSFSYNDILWWFIIIE